MKEIGIQGISGQLTPLEQQNKKPGSSLGDDFQKMLQKSITSTSVKTR